MTMLTSLVFIMLFVISLSLDIVDHIPSIHKQLKETPSQFTEQSPSLRSFNLSSHISAKSEIKHNAGSGMYGISGVNYKDGECALVKYDTGTGNATTLQLPNASIITGESLGCLDAVHNIYFFLYEERTSIIHVNSGLYPYNLVDGVTYDPILLPMISMTYSRIFVGAGDVCVSDPNTGDLYVFGIDAAKAGNQLLLKVSFDPKTNKSTITQIGSYSGVNNVPLVGGQIATYDTKRNMLWVAAETGVDEDIDYFYIDANTGEIQKKINFRDINIQTGTYNAPLDAIVGLNAIETDTEGDTALQMVYADPVTLKVTKKFDTFSNDLHSYCFLSVNSQDVDGGIYYAVVYQSSVTTCDQANDTYSGVLVGVNVTTGNVVYQPQICTWDGLNTCPLDLFYWDGK